MKTAEIIAQALLSLRQHSLRSILSALGVAVAAAAVVALLSVAEGVRRESADQLRELGADTFVVRRSPLGEAQARAARARHSPGLVFSDARAVAGIPRIAVVAPVRELATVLSGDAANGQIAVLAVSREYFQLRGLHAVSGRTLADLDVEDRSAVFVAGASTLPLFTHRDTGATLVLGAREFRLVGILGPRAAKAQRAPIMTLVDPNRTVFLPLGAESGGGPDAQLSEMLVKVEGSQGVTAAAAAARRLILGRHQGVEDFSVIVPQELLARAMRGRKVFSLVLAAIAAISLFVGGIGIMNIMLASASERTGEIGVRRAVGASRGDIAAQFLAESAAIALVGGASGTALGYGVARFIGQQAGWESTTSPWMALLALLLAGLTGLTSGLYPAVRAARLDPMAAVRHP